MPRSNKTLIEKRPAETASLSLAAALAVILGAAGVEVQEADLAAIIVGVGAVSAVVTAIVNWARAKRA